MLKINDEYQVVIEKQDHFGLGLVRIDDILVFVEGALPEEEVIIKIFDIKKKYAQAKVKEFIKTSVTRVTAQCPYFDFCGGCQLMHQDYMEQLKFKEKKVKELLTRFASLNDIRMFPIVHGNDFNYRNKVVFHGEDGKLGFYREKSHKVIQIEKCLLVDKEIQFVYRMIASYLEKYINEQLSEVMIRKTSIGQVMLDINGNINKEQFLEYMEETEVDSIYLNQKLISGHAYILEEMFGKKFRILPKAFFQVNYEMMLKLYQIVLDYYKEKRYSTVLDLYCGTGTIGIILSSYVEKVIGVEIVKDAVDAAIMNKELNQVLNIDFILGKVEDNINKFSNIDSIVVDPPRSGLDKNTISTILKIEPKSIVYVSCDPVTLARDLKYLLESYELIEVHPVDMFPNTYHVECVCILELK